MSQYVTYITNSLYAASYLVIFLAIIRLRGKMGDSDLIDSFYVLAFFGLFHFLADFIRIFVALFQFTAFSTVVLGVRVGLNILSFQLLLFFGFMILSDPQRRLRWVIYLSPLVIGIHYAIAINIPYSLYSAARYAIALLAVPSSFIASVAFLYLAIRLASRRLRSLMWDSYVLAAAFLGFGLLRIFSVFDPREIIVPSIPVLIMRAILALIVAIFVVRILSIFKLERS